MSNFYTVILSNLFLTLSMVFANSAAFAKSWKFECANQSTISITPSSGEYPLQAIYKTANGTMKLVGDKDFDRDNEGYLVDIIRLIDPANFNYQVVLEYTESVGTTVWVEQVDTQTNQSEDFQCKLVSFQK
ncbi:hypothetical protein DOM22_18765 [Bdellovibrio sp. ZAP7]|uniref:hypothetical protein n=1 Tax=Bdellovibrio sp. ZAP7 TaxID=2231053 RepID=UPI00115A2550|nr:hypothetical protein [Bdellovibrio sp. ZAP7]QDK47057.1 hypothetical protein DOM22_18765 [Bdellovibrio sp. ZAP7]